MSRTDLTNQQVIELKLLLRELSNSGLDAPRHHMVMKARSLVERLAGEVLELRERESVTRYLHEIEGAV